MRVAFLLASLTLAGCIGATSGVPTAFVNTRNAPTSAQANLNSLQAAIGSVYLYDMTSGAAIYRVRFQANEVASNRGNFLHRASSGISFDLRNVPPAAATDVANAVSLAVGNSLKFEMSQYEQRTIADPEGVLNAQVPLTWFADRERSRANDPGYRYIFVIEGFYGDDISMLWGGQDADGLSLKVDTQVPAVPQVQLEVESGTSIQCQGKQNTCVLTAQVYRLLEENGALRLELDTALTRSDLIQRMLNNQRLPETT